MLEASQILDASLVPAMVIAAVAGLLSFLSPCVLPIVPPYLAYMGGVSVSDMEDEAASRKRVLLAAAFFVLGLSTVFLLLGFAFSAFWTWKRRRLQTLLTGKPLSNLLVSLTLPPRVLERALQGRL